MRIGAILPHLEQFGGVRRFLEIGNCFVKRGIDYTIFAQRGTHCSWFDYKGSIRNWSKIHANHILIGDPPSFRILPRVHGKIYIYVIAGGRYTPMYQKVYGRYPFILNNRVFRRHFSKAHLVEGGVNVHHFLPKKKEKGEINIFRFLSKKLAPATDGMRVLFYNIDREGKNIPHIKHSLNGIPGIQLVGLRGLKDNALVEAYQGGDFLVAWESRAGWCNMAAEALSCGLTVVTNGVNCEPFIDKVIKVNDLRKFFSNPENRKIRKPGSMEKFSWEKVTDQLLRIFKHYSHHEYKHKH